MRKLILPVFAIALVFAFTITVSAANDCDFDIRGKTMTLLDDCTTDATITVPDKMTLDGNGYTITAVKAAGGGFAGAVIQNEGESMHIVNLTIEGNLNGASCLGGDNRYRGIMFLGASGSVSESSILNIRIADGSGCQEGNGIEVRNFDNNTETSRVTVSGTTVSGYQKTGIIAGGNASLNVFDSRVIGFGPIGYIAQNGIQFGYGATGMVKKSTVNGNAYTGATWVSAGILVLGGPYYFGYPYTVGVQVIQNEVHGNDVGVYVSQYTAGGTPADSPTNTKIVNNNISKDDMTNNCCAGLGYHAGVAIVGNNDKVISNTISGDGYDSTLPEYRFAVDADMAYSINAKVHANK